jgi:hypothetical protein
VKRFIEQNLSIEHFVDQRLEARAHLHR